MKDWEFTETSLLYFDVFLTIRNLLTISSTQLTNELDDLKEQNALFMYIIFDEYWLKPFRTFVMGTWKAMEGDRLRRTLSQWSPLMPDRFLRKVVEEILLPKLKQAIKADWNPRDQSRALQTWLLPWTEILGKRNMKAMFEEDVKPRITPIFGEWKPSKPIGLLLVTPWTGVLDDE